MKKRYKKDGTLYAKFDPIKKREYDKRYSEKHHEELLIKKREYYQNNKNKFSERWTKIKSDPLLHQKKKDCDKNYTLKNHDEIINYKNNYRETHKEELRLKQREYMSDIQKKKDYTAYIKNRIKTDPLFAVCFRLRCRIRIAFKTYTKTGKIVKAREYGIDYQAIIEHLKPFPEDMSKYHIDHIRPLCSFNFVNPDGSHNLEEIKKAFAPENHR